MTSSNLPDKDYVDSEVIRMLRQLKRLSLDDLYYQLSHIPQVLVFSSIKRLSREKKIGYCVLEDDDSLRAESNEKNDSFRERITPDTPMIRSGNELKIKALRSAGTSRSDHKYLWLFKGDRQIAYIGGGDCESPLAQIRKAEVEQLIEMGILHSDVENLEIKRIVAGVQRRNKVVKRDRQPQSNSTAERLESSEIST